MSSTAQDATGEVVGNVYDKNSGVAIYGARVFIEDFDKLYQDRTTPDGRFRISAVPPGEYLLKILFQNDTMEVRIVKVPIDGFANAGEIEYTNNILELGPVVASADQGLKLDYGFLPVKSLSSEEIDKSVIKFDIQSLVASMSSDVQLTDDGQLVFRGARKGDMIYILDGMKVQGQLNMPSVGIGKMMVYSGGLPAKYGDTMGGVVVVESKSYFDLLRAEKSRQLRSGK
jgi:hypothetical protein